jgi:hypothetical protein
MIRLRRISKWKGKCNSLFVLPPRIGRQVWRHHLMRPYRKFWHPLAKNWSLSEDYEYIVRCERLGSQLTENLTLAQAGVREGDVLEIQMLPHGG